MITDRAIRDRFIFCLAEVEYRITLHEIAKKIGCSTSYLSQIKKKPNPQIPVVVIGLFCQTYNYSLTYIITGKGEKKTKVQKTKEDKLIEIIGDLIGALLEADIRPDIRDLIRDSKKYISKN